MPYYIRSLAYIVWIKPSVKAPPWRLLSRKSLQLSLGTPLAPLPLVIGHMHITFVTPYKPRGFPKYVL